MLPYLVLYFAQIQKPLIFLQVIAGLLEVKPGWYSAMAQGQAISLLVRAAYFSGNKKYIESAAKATSLFLVNVTQGEETYCVLVKLDFYLK